MNEKIDITSVPVQRTNTNSRLHVKVKKINPYAPTPKYAKSGDAGMDLVAVTKEYDSDGNVVYGTGLAFEIPHGYVGLLFPRSSNAKYLLSLTNSVGVIDSGYRGEVIMKFKPTDIFDENFIERDDKELDYKVGDKIGQLIIIPYPEIEFEEVEELNTTERGEGGFGHTGK